MLADFGNPHKYFKGIVDARLTSGVSQGVGTSRHCDLQSMMGMKQFIDEEIIDWKEGEEFTYIVTKTAAPIKNGIAIWQVTGDRQQSEINVNIRYEPAGIMGQLMKGKLKKEFNKQIQVGLMDIKQLFETRRQQAA